MQRKTHRKITDEDDNDRLEIQKSNFRQYAFTLRRTNLKKGVTKEDYFNHFKRFEDDDITIVESIFEETAGLHMHGIVQIPHDYPLFKFRIRGWNMKLVEMFNEIGWRFYYMKEQHNKDYEDDQIEEDPCLHKSLFK